MKTIVPILLAFLLGLAVFWGFNRSAEHETRAEATVLLEQVRNVAKLVTVEGDVSELYNSTDTRNVTMYLPLPARFSFQKKATVEVRGTVLVGYDLSKMRVDVDEATQTVRLGNLPQPGILAIDHEMIYRNLEESWFNTFTAEDYSKLNQEAKERLRAEALKSRLLQEAEAQGNAILETIRFLVEGAGYRLEVEGVEVGSRE